MFTRCPNRVCPGRQWQLLKAFAAIMDMEGVGEKQVATFQEAGLVHTAADFYRLAKEQLAALERVGETSAENMLRGDRGLEVAAVRQGPVRARHRGRRLGDRP